MMTDLCMRLTSTICLSLIAGGGIQALSGGDILQSCGGISGTGLFFLSLIIVTVMQIDDDCEYVIMISHVVTLDETSKAARGEGA